MPQPAYGIYQTLPGGASVWIENVFNLNSARTRITELAQRSSGQFAVFDLRNPARAVLEVRSTGTYLAWHEIARSTQ